MGGRERKRATDRARGRDRSKAAPLNWDDWRESNSEWSDHNRIGQVKWIKLSRMLCFNLMSQVQ